MGWILCIAFQAVFLYMGIRRDQHAGLWSGSKFLFTLGFAALECVLLITPTLTMDMNGRAFPWVMGGAGAIAALNFVWFIVACRRWRLPDGRTSLEAYRDTQAGR
jgi:hypothetical protein